MLRAAPLIACAALIGAAATARAEPLAVLGVEALALSEAQGASVTEALRTAARARHEIQLMPGKDFVELRFLFGCNDEATLAPCMAQAGRSLVADKLVMATLRADAAAGRIEVRVRLLDVAKEAVTRELREALEPGALEGAALTATATRWLEALLGSGRTSVAAEITATLPPRVEPAPTEAATGPTGSAAPTGSTGAATLAATSPLPEEQAAPPSPGRAAKVAGTVLLIAGAAVAGAAIYTGVSAQNLASAAHDDLDLVAQGAPTYVRANAAWFASGSEDCTPPAGAPGGSSGNLESFKAHCGDGKTMASITTALWVGAAALALGGTTAVIVGARAARNVDRNAEHEHRPATAGAARRFTLVPSLGPRGGGLAASLVF